jgi:predicted neutral ceramidase superfamily lipid hydrolase
LKSGDELGDVVESRYLKAERSFSTEKNFGQHPTPVHAVIEMDKKKLVLLVTIFYPLTFVMIVAGFLAFILLLFNISFLVVGCMVFWFYFLSVAVVFSMIRKPLKMLGFYKLFLALLMAVGALAIISTVLVLMELWPA